MTEEINIPESEVAESEVAPLSVGATLSAAREAHSYSLEYVASKLKLSIRQLSALESDDFSALPGNTFVRGFVRNYARLLEIDAQPLLNQLSTVLPTERVQVALPEVPDATALHALVMARASGPTKSLWAMVLLGLFLGSGLVFWYLQYPATPNLLVSSPVAPQANVLALPLAQEASEVAITIKNASKVDGLAQTVVSLEAASDVASTVATRVLTASDVASLDNKNAAIRVYAEMESWVQVVDADQKIQISSILPAGSERFVSGKAPFKVVIGNAPKTKLFYLGNSVDLTPFSRADVATLELK